MRCCKGRVLVQREPEVTQSAGGIVIPEVYRRPVNIGTVLESGCDDVEKGERVMFSLYNGYEFKMDGMDCVVIKPRDLIATVPQGCHVG